MTAPASLRVPDLDALWLRVRRRLEARGCDSRGRLPLPPLSSSARLALKSLLGPRVGQSVDLTALEAGLVRLGVGASLTEALAHLGHEVSAEPSRLRAARAERRQARELARATVADWPEPWAREWIDEVIRAGIFRNLEAAPARALLQSIRAVLDYLAQERPAPISRIDLAARLLGSAHALDPGTRIEAALSRALAFRLDATDRRDIWAQAGVHFDLTSAPALTWRLPLSQGCGLGPLATAALAASVPLHISRLALEAHPAAVPRGSRILVVENPRIVEAAAQRHASTPVISTNGNPSSTVLLLLSQLLASGAELRYHGDFDAAGLAICARVMALGLIPWRMSAADYLEAVASADAEGAVLPRDTRAPGPTPWEPSLQSIFAQNRRIVHQERLLSALIGAR